MITELISPYPIVLHVGLNPDHSIKPGEICFKIYICGERTAYPELFEWITNRLAALCNANVRQTKKGTTFYFGPDNTEQEDRFINLTMSLPNAIQRAGNHHLSVIINNEADLLEVELILQSIGEEK